MNDTEAIQLLESMLRIPSLSGNEGQLATFLIEQMNHLGFEAFIDGAGNAVGVIGGEKAKRRKGEKEEVQSEQFKINSSENQKSEIRNQKSEDTLNSIVLLGHMDTVPGDIPVRFENGRLYGRGAVDAKGPLAAFIAAAARLRKQVEHLPVCIVVIGCVEEEAPSSKGAHFVVPRYQPDFCIVGEPSGWDRMTLGYKGFMRATAHLEQDASHSAHPVPTVAERACETWSRIREAATRFNAGRERLFDQVLPALVGIQSGSDGCRDWAELRINLRLPVDLPPETAQVWLSESVPDGQLEVFGATPAWVGPRTTPLHRAVSRAIRTQGGEPGFLVKTGTADLNIVAPAWGCPALAYGPGDASLDHTPQEHIVLDEYLRGIAVLEKTLQNIFTP